MFTGSVGMSWRDYLTSARMLRAMTLLATRGRSVSSTATAVGFDSQGSFTRAFTQFSGETPSSYRNRIHQDPEPAG